ncbi:acyl-CoA N-acyltransferase [Aspergillus varians]
MQQRFQVRVASEEDFPELIEKLWESFENPYQPILRLFFPILDNDRPRSLQTCIKGQLEEYHQQQPQVTWVKVVDTEANDRIAAATKWYFYDKNPYPEGGSTVVADWYPEGIARELATKAVHLFDGPREQRSRRPHAFLHIAFTVPEYRRQGLGRLFMEWGLRVADERGWEAWLDASKFGRPLYEQFGFRKVLANYVNPMPDRDLSDEEKKEWEVYAKVMLPVDVTVMWRPPKGIYIEGETPMPWTAETE